KCINVTIPQDGVILGNQRGVGKRIRYECKAGYTALNGPFAVCLDTGVWNEYSSCITVPAQTSTAFPIGPTIGSSCGTDADCIETEGRCIEGICFCHPLYRYSTSYKNCLKVCNSMSDTFQEIKKEFIVNFNDIEEATIYSSPNDCETACAEDPNCSSFEAWKDNGVHMCTRSSVSLNMAKDAAPSAVQFNPNVQLYTRLCV
ncbi:uncharacterized protein LOC132726719, partial [Ruditapes philippinarum]|uniref:uncharacterized protein LOC132726719 n=1 Tax=Ruditapes philippinarum TaxID=129788 RepID=UPI00295B03EB